MYKLSIEDDEGQTVVVPLIRDEITVGRQEGNTIRLTERNVSRRHARFVRRNGALYLEDLGSYIGTKLNEAPLTAPTALNDGDQIVIGDYKLAVKVERPSAAAPIPGRAISAASEMPLPVQEEPPSTAAVAPIPEMLEGAPTIPVRTLADQGLVPGLAPTTPPARLLVTSKPLEGAAFVLDRASVVIGRTPENDVVLNHKSISRHHAKIIRDGDRYVVVDLESANGVRVNGAEYERVELRPGDMLELGHVRLRFVHGTDDGALDYERLRGEGGSKRAIIYGAVGVAAVTTIALLLFSGGEEPKPKPTASAQVPRPASAPPASNAAPSAQPAETVAALLAQAKTAARDEKWAEAVEATDRAIAAAPDSEEARALRQTLVTEQTNAGHLASVKAASEAADHGEALAAFSAISEDSVYKDRGRSLYETARDRFLAQHLALADKARSEGRCDEARKEADLVLELDEQNQAARGVVSRCKRAAARVAAAAAAPVRQAARTQTSARAGNRVPAGAGTTSAARATTRLTSTEALAPPPAGDADDLIQQAQQAWSRGQYASAIESSRKALRVRPGLTRAHQIIAVCACSLRDAQQAARSYEKLDDQRIRQYVKQLCQKSGVVLD